MSTQITDDRSQIVNDVPDGRVTPGSVLLAYGLTGTAYQRHFTDDLFHAANGTSGNTYAEMLEMPGVHLVYLAPRD